MNKDKYQELAKEIRESNYTIIMTGAGMSTESGLSDFRSKTGIWKEYDPMKVATVNALNNDYDKFHSFYTLRCKSNIVRSPHEGHYILAKWEKQGLIQGLVTQNVDSFHREAGSKNIYELHGSIKKFKCSSCGHESDKITFFDKLPCELCGGK